MQIDLEGVRLRDLRHWFSDSWFFVPKLGRAVYCIDLDGDALVGEDELRRSHIVPIEDVDIATPELGYVVFPNPQGGRNIAQYLYYSGQRSYRKGFAPRRVKMKTLSLRGRSFHIINTPCMNVRSYPGFIDAVFKPEYIPEISQAWDVCASKGCVALSQHWLLSRTSKEVTPDIKANQCLWYKGLPVAGVAPGGVVQLPKKLNFLYL